MGLDHRFAHCEGLQFSPFEKGGLRTNLSKNIRILCFHRLFSNCRIIQFRFVMKIP